MRTILLSCLLLLFVAVNAQETGNIKGVVTDLNTGLPINGAEISIKDMDSIPISSSNASGEYVIKGIPVNKYLLKVSHQDYETKDNIKITIVANKFEDYNVELEKTSANAGFPLFSILIAIIVSVGITYFVVKTLKEKEFESAYKPIKLKPNEKKIQFYL